MKEKEAGIEIKGIGPYLFILPILIGVGIFGFGCFVYVLMLSFTETTLLMPAQWVGLNNYFYVLFKSTYFLTSLAHTAYYVIWAVPLSLVVGLGLGLAMYKKIKGGTLFRVIYLLPWVSSAVIIALIFKYIFNPEWGIVNWFLTALGFGKIIWGETLWTTLPVIATMSAWQSMGYGMIIFLGGVSSIPDNIFAAASLEGTNKIQMLRYITLPLLKPTIFFFTVMSVIGSFQVFDIVYVFLEGDYASTGYANLNSPGLVCAYLTYMMAFRELRFGMASSMAMLMFLVTLGIIMIQRHFMGRKVVMY